MLPRAEQLPHPSATRIDLHTAVRQPVPCGKLLQTRRKHHFRIPSQRFVYHLAQPCLQCLVGKVGIRRTDNLHLAHARTGQETFLPTGHQSQPEVIGINPEIQVDQRTRQFLPGCQQTRTQLLDGAFHLGKRRTGRHRHVYAIGLRAERQPPCTGIGTHQQQPQLFVVYHIRIRHISVFNQAKEQRFPETTNKTSIKLCRPPRKHPVSTGQSTRKTVRKSGQLSVSEQK